MESNLTVRWSKNHRKFEKFENRGKQRKNEGFINFSSLNMHCRSADAANHLNALQGEARMTRRAYLARMCMLDRVIRRR